MIVSRWRIDVVSTTATVASRNSYLGEHAGGSWSRPPLGGPISGANQYGIRSERILGNEGVGRIIDPMPRFGVADLQEVFHPCGCGQVEFEPPAGVIDLVERQMAGKPRHERLKPDSVGLAPVFETGRVSDS